MWAFSEEMHLMLSSDLHIHVHTYVPAHTHGNTHTSTAQSAIWESQAENPATPRPFLFCPFTVSVLSLLFEMGESLDEHEFPLYFPSCFGVALCILWVRGMDSWTVLTSALQAYVRAVKALLPSSSSLSLNSSCSLCCLLYLIHDGRGAFD